MKNLHIFYFLFFIFFLSCETNVSRKKTNTDSTIEQPLSIDTNRITILPNNEIAFFSLKDSLPATLSNEDLVVIEKLLVSAVEDHNKGIDSANLYSGFINLKKYKCQYVPYINTKDEKKIFINCFCNGVSGFDNWKTKLVEIEDGGVCFFNLTINVSKQSRGLILINGPG